MERQNVEIEKVRLTGPAAEAAIFKDANIEGILATAAKLLVRANELLAASLLANASISITHWEHDNWEGGQDTWRLYLAVPADTYLALESREEIEKIIDRAIATPMRAVSTSDFITVEITTTLDRDPDWRRKTLQAVTGEGINNQGRVHSQNIAAREFDNLRFRSSAEVCFYRALKAAGVAFAPLCVVVGHGGAGQAPRRIEPDFIIFKDGLVTVIEIDGDLFHTETPYVAHRRLKFLTDEGAHLDRLNANECDTYEKAREAVRLVLMQIEKRRNSKI